MTTVTLYHNPRCRTSRTALEMLRKRGIEPTIIEYLNTPPTAPEIKRILQMLDIPAKELLRVKEGKAVGISKDMTEAQILGRRTEQPDCRFRVSRGHRSTPPFRKTGERRAR